MSEFIMQPWYKKRRRRRVKYTDVTTPFIAIGAGEKPPWGDLDDTCPLCGAECERKDSIPPGLQYISHCGRTWLRGDIQFHSLKEADEAARAASE